VAAALAVPRDLLLGERACCYRHDFEVIQVNDVFMLAAAAAFAVLSWLLVVLCDRLMGNKP